LELERRRDPSVGEDGGRSRRGEERVCSKEKVKEEREMGRASTARREGSDEDSGLSAEGEDAGSAEGAGENAADEAEDVKGDEESTVEGDQYD
jgi:hypothetical protein